MVILGSVDGRPSTIDITQRNQTASVVASRSLLQCFAGNGEVRVMRVVLSNNDESNKTVDCAMHGLTADILLMNDMDVWYVDSDGPNSISYGLVFTTTNNKMAMLSATTNINTNQQHSRLIMQCDRDNRAVCVLDGGVVLVSRNLTMTVYPAGVRVQGLYGMSTTDISGSIISCSGKPHNFTIAVAMGKSVSIMTVCQYEVKSYNYLTIDRDIAKIECMGNVFIVMATDGSVSMHNSNGEVYARGNTQYVKACSMSVNRSLTWWCTGRDGHRGSMFIYPSRRGLYVAHFDGQPRSLSQLIVTNTDHTMNIIP